MTVEPEDGGARTSPKQKVDLQLAESIRVHPGDWPSDHHGKGSRAAPFPSIINSYIAAPALSFEKSAIAFTAHPGRHPGVGRHDKLLT